MCASRVSSEPRSSPLRNRPCSLMRRALAVSMACPSTPRSPWSSPPRGRLVAPGSQSSRPRPSRRLCSRRPTPSTPDRRIDGCRACRSRTSAVCSSLERHLLIGSPITFRRRLTRSIVARSQRRAIHVARPDAADAACSMPAPTWAGSGRSSSAGPVSDADLEARAAGAGVRMVSDIWDDRDLWRRRRTADSRSRRRGACGRLG